MARLTGLLGILAILLFAFLFSTARKSIRVRTVVVGLTLQFVFAILVLRVGFGERVMRVAGDAVNRLLSYSYAGSQFVFGDLGSKMSKFGVIFAFQVLPIIIFIAAFFSILYYYGVMQFVIQQLAKVMMRSMGASGVESLNVAASIFMGQTEAPLTIRPYLPKVTLSELMTIMTSGMAHVSGAMLGAYIMLGIEARHLLGAVIMTAPGTIVISKMLVPETEKPITNVGKIDEVGFEQRSSNVLDAAAKGTTDGLHLALNVAAILISFLALIALLDGILGGTHNFLAGHGFRWFPARLETIFG
ncbi:MAG TPA: Na+ dependent nucleoside transporter N-terminal domain-containing protein, partial [Terracidiphilus sp.]